jgi:hypothetical protein
MQVSRISILLFCVLFLTTCSAKYPFCISENTKGLKIDWGTIYFNGKAETRYSLQANGALLRYIDSKKKTELGKFSERRFCSILAEVHETILQTQAINEVGDTLDFVEYSNPKLGIFFSAKWNPKFKTKNSIHFRALYDSLMIWRLELKN